ncbi:transcriptional regulator [Thermococcus sp. P6]|uniref:Tfx family DNA-binding protein n=1 Tax=Thermococcus sp. P6 TaxID=122420 RepID=UPI000B599FB2|nr:Tfx family DNA-binding protein [Thermococcus sp. P6]ASJ10580.1 transcriptional regulator [Thermococcus sp. P6]
MSGKSFFTKHQIRILQLRARGMKQSEIAELLGTTRANVSILERRALEKVEKARNTILIWEQINSRLSVRVKRGEDIFTVPERLFKKADELGIHVPYSTAEVIAYLVENAPIEDRIARRDFILFLDSGNNLRIGEYLPGEEDPKGP